MNYALSVLSASGPAEEAVHEAFLKAFEKLDQFRGEARIDTWLWSILRNECLQYLRKSSTRREVVEIPEGTIENAPSEELSADAEMIERASRDELNKALKLLSAHQREVLELRVHSELSMSEIAEVTGMTESTVKSHLFRAKESLLRTMRKEFDV